MQVPPPQSLATLVEAFDWASTPLGPRERWPASLVTFERLCLESCFPTIVFWGAELVQIYNDAFRPILGDRHPSALGQRANDCSPEMWDAIGPLLTGAFERAESTSVENMLLPIRRDGIPEERYFTFSSSPARDGGEIVGVFCVVHETTAVVRTAHEAAQRNAVQRASLPKALPHVAGVRFSADYHAAEAESLVGGDWYDAFELTDGRIVLSVGDVMGSGLEGAVTMAAARQAIRGAAQIYPDPHAVLDAADRALHSEQPDRIVTAFVGVFEPITGYFTYASAGHPPPLVRRHDGTIVELSGSSLPLGLRSEALTHRETERTIHLAPGALLVLYTDGLTEATRDTSVGESRLRTALASADTDRDDNVAIAIRRAVLDAGPSDDVAILTLLVVERPAGDTHRWTVAATDAAMVVGLRREAVALLREGGASEGDAHDAELILGELLGNVVRHTRGDVEVVLDVAGEYPVAHVLDRGSGFTFLARLPQDELSENGRGLFISAMLARDLSVVRRPDGGSHARAVLPCRRRVVARIDL